MEDDLVQFGDTGQPVITGLICPKLPKGGIYPSGFRIRTFYPCNLYIIYI
jgi:hypothetical protein